MHRLFFNFRRLLVGITPVIVLGLVYSAWQQWRWAGLVLILGGVLMWVLLHFTHMMLILRRAAQRPKGYVASAVMFNAKLKPCMTLIQVTAVSRSLGVECEESNKDEQVYIWKDNAGDSVRTHFTGGHLKHWRLTRQTPA